MFSLAEISYQIQNLKNNNIPVENLENLFQYEVDSEQYDDFFDENINRVHFLYNDILIDVV